MNQRANMLPRWAKSAITQLALGAMLFSMVEKLEAQSGYAAKTAAEITAEKNARTPAEQKITSALLDKVAEMKAAGVTPKSMKVMNTAQTFGDKKWIQVDEKARVFVSVHPAKDAAFDAVLAMLVSKGMAVSASNREFKLIEGWAYYDDLKSIAAEPSVRAIEPVFAPVTSVGSVNTEGDAKSRAPLARQLFSGANGGGVKVGVLSDGCDSYQAAISNGNLIGLTVLDNTAGGDEGTAMLEIVQDIVPNSSLYFATAFGGPTKFINNIQALADAGCKVIVDDIKYLNEPAFEDGPIAQKVDQVSTAQDVVYASSSGNNQTTSYASQGYTAFTGSVPSVLTGLGTPHDFGTTSGNFGYYQQPVSISTGWTVTLTWADPYGASVNDYDLYILNSAGTAILGSATTTQNGTQDPFEIATIAANTTARVVVVLKGGGVARPFRLQYYGGFTTTVNPFATRAYNTFGHACAATALGTGAIDHTSPSTAATYSSAGPVQILFGANQGTRLKPDISSFAGVSTSTPGFTTFFGTSAAAPHVAGLAALVRSAKPTVTGAQVRDILRSTALDLGVVGADSIFGTGRADAFNAVAQAIGTTYIKNVRDSIPNATGVAFRDSVTVTETGNVNTVSLTFSSTHSQFREVILELTDPDGNTRRVGKTNASATLPHIILDGRLTTSVAGASGTNLINGYKPLDTLRAFGSSIAGKWILTVRDTATGVNRGVVQQWGLTFNGLVPLSAPAFISTPPTTAIQGEAFQYTALATGNPSPTYSLDPGFPAGMTINSASGVITYTPTALGAFTATIKATNPQGSATQNLSVTTIAPDWVKQTAATGLPADDYYYQIHPAGGTDTLNLWILGTASANTGPTSIQRTTNGGLTWISATGNFPTSNTVYGIAIGGVTDQIAVVGRVDGSAYRTTNGGTTWTAVALPATPATNFINAVQFVSSTVGFIQGDPNGGNWPVYKTTDAGATWTALAAPAPVAGDAGQNQGMFWLNETNGWFNANPSTRVYYTTNGGAAWAFGTPAFQPEFGGTLAASSPSNVYVALRGASAPYVQNSADGGATWTSPSPGITFGVTSLFAIPATDTVYATSTTGIFRSANKGGSWVKALTPTAPGLNFITFANAKKGWAVGGSGTILSFGTSGTSSTVTPVGGGVPKTFALSQNYPNPFNPSTTINYSLASVSDVKLKVYDLLGRVVANLVSERQSAGTYRVSFNAARLSSGVYFYRLEANTFVETKKMLLVK